MSVDGRRAAWQITEAVRHGDAELVIGLPARLAVVATALAPNLVARIMETVTRLLPGADSQAGGERYAGWESQSRWAPSILTRLSDRAAAENNELPA